MNPIPEIKRVMMRALLRAEGPMPEEALDNFARQVASGRPLQSDINEARKEMESDGFISGLKDELDGRVSWSLTEKGAHKARQLN